MSAIMERTEVEFAIHPGWSNDDAGPVASMVERLMTIHAGERKGYYEVLADCGPMTYVDLANFTGISESASREWLDTQVLLGVLFGDSRQVPAWERRYLLPASKAALLLDLEDPFAGLDRPPRIAA